MSDIHEVSTNIDEPKQEELSSLNDNLKIISISDDEDDIDDSTVLTSILDKDLLKENLDDDIDIKPRPRRTKYPNDRHSESHEDDSDHQNVPKIKDDAKSTTKTKVQLDDDCNTQSPAYIPRKGKFYEHDDRTLNDNDRAKPDAPRNKYRLSKDSDAKWQHDLYFHDEQRLPSRYSMPRQNHPRTEHDNRKQFLLNDYMFRSRSIHNDQRRQVPQEEERKSSLDRMNTFESNRHSNYRRGTSTTSSRREQHVNPIDERVFHRRRNFTNSQFQQHDNSSKRNEFGRQLSKPSHENNQFRHNDDHRFHGKSEKTRNIPPRFLDNGLNTERTKRYSHMRNNVTHPNQVQGPSTSQIKHHQERDFIPFEQNDWLQISSLPKQLITPQMYYQQTTSRYVTLNNPTASISEQV